MLNQMLEEHRPIKDQARFIYESLALEGELPMLSKVLVGTGDEMRAGFRSGPVQFREQVCPGLELDVWDFS